MKMAGESLIGHPVDAVFEAYRDHISEVAEYIDDIEAIHVRSREASDGAVRLHNEWVSNREIPVMARSFIKPEHLRWDDYATWFEDGRRCEWRIETRGAFKEAIRCAGETRLLPLDDGTKVVLEGDLSIEVNKVPGVPALMARSLAPAIEKFIVALITPNLDATNVALGRFLDARR